MEVNNIELRRLERADPTVDANEAIRRHDLRFLAIRGYATEVPGIDDYEERFSEKYGYRVIEGTSDALINDTDRTLQNLAIRYAKAYNSVNDQSSS